MLRSCLLVGGLCAAALVSAADSDVPEAAAKAREQYDAAVQKVKGQYSAAVAGLTDDYTKHLAELLARAKETGNLDAATTLKAEADRMERGGFGTPGKLPPDAQKAYQSRDAQVTKLKAETNARLKELHAGLVRELADLEQAATKGDQLAVATALHTYRQQVERTGAPILAGGNLAVIRANNLYEKALKDAGVNLLHQFDRAGERIAALRLMPKQRAELTDVVKAEKELFKTRGLVPWSAPMRPATIAYVNAVQAARARFRKDCEAELVKLTKANDSAGVREVTDELADTSEARVIAFWGHQAGDSRRGRIALYSNGTIGNPNGKMTWHFDKAGRLVLRWPNEQAPGGAWVDTCGISRDGKVYAGQNQRGGRINGTLAND